MRARVEVIADRAIRVALHDRELAEQEPRIDVALIFGDQRIERLLRHIELAGFGLRAREQQA